MPELRRDPGPTPPERDGEIDVLLVDGLDRYFGGRYEEAIHLWTRVLFLDRSHPRARAYIDRARTALAERQRRSDELLAASGELLDRGEISAARELLTQAVATTGDDEHAAALRLRLERLERAIPGPGPRRAVPPVAESVPGWTWKRRSTALVVSLAVALAALLVIVAVTSPSIRELLGLSDARDRSTMAVAPARVPVLSSADAALVRARTFYERGRLADALATLDRVDINSPLRAEADALRIDIQRLLLASARDRAKAPRPGEGTKR